MAVAAYAVSAIAAALTSARAAGAPLPSRPFMRLLTYTFIGLVIPLASSLGSARFLPGVVGGGARSAVSALHLSQFNEGDASWPVELGHHASLLAFAILYQDFPFALADLFLKRAITLLALVTAVCRGRHFTSAGRRQQRRTIHRAARTLWAPPRCAIRRFARWPRGSSYDRLIGPTTTLRRIATHAQFHEDVPSLLDDACARLAPALSARVVRWRELPARAGVGPSRLGDRPFGVATVEVPAAEPPRYALDVGELTGGRRLLSDDRAALDAIALLLGRRIDAIRLAHERYVRQLREQEIGRLATEAELRALRAQINPHFLFNALTTIGYLIQTAPTRALDTLMKLTALLRAGDRRASSRRSAAS